MGIQWGKALATQAWEPKFISPEFRQKLLDTVVHVSVIPKLLLRYCWWRQEHPWKSEGHQAWCTQRPTRDPVSNKMEGWQPKVALWPSFAHSDTHMFTLIYTHQDFKKVFKKETNGGRNQKIQKGKSVSLWPRSCLSCIWRVTNTTYDPTAYIRSQLLAECLVSYYKGQCNTHWYSTVFFLYTFGSTLCLTQTPWWFGTCWTLPKVK